MIGEREFRAALLGVLICVGFVVHSGSETVVESPETEEVGLVFAT